MANRPIPPEVSLETWRELVHAALEFRALEPWKYMYDSDLVGILDSSTAKVRLASILGNAREFFALVIYRGQDGVRWILRMVWEEDIDAYDFDWGISQNCLKVEFTSKKEADKRDQEILKQIGFKSPSRQAHAWPIFRSHRPGCAPWYLDQVEAESLLHDLRHVTAFVRLVAKRPKLYDEHPAEEIPFLPMHSTEPESLTLQHVKWHPIALPPESAPTRYDFTDEAKQELLGLPKCKGLVLEVNHFYAPTVIGEGPRPYFPKMMLAVDAQSGFIHGMKLGDGSETVFQDITGQGLLDVCRNLKCRPETLLVSKDEVYEAFKHLAKDLKINMRKVDRLPMLELAYTTMRGDLRMGSI